MSVESDLQYKIVFQTVLNGGEATTQTIYDLMGAVDKLGEANLISDQAWKEVSQTLLAYQQVLEGVKRSYTSLVSAQTLRLNQKTSTDETRAQTAAIEAQIRTLAGWTKEQEVAAEAAANLGREEAAAAKETEQATAMRAFGGGAGNTVSQVLAATAAIKTSGESVAGTIRGLGNFYPLIVAQRTFGAVGASLTGIATAAIKMSASYQDAFASVARTTQTEGGNAAGQIEYIRQQLKQMDTEIPLTFQDLAKIATMGNELGVPAVALANFTKTVAQYSTLTGTSAETTANALGSLIQILHLSTDEITNLGSAISYTGRLSVASEPEIVSMMQKIASTTHQAGMTTPEVTGLAAALASLKEAPERSQGALEIYFKTLNNAAADGGKSLQNFAAVMGVSMAKAKDDIVNNPMEALKLLLERLHSLDSVGKTEVLKDLGLSGVRVSEVLRRLSGNIPLITSLIDDANKSFKDGTDLQTQFAKRTETLQQKWIELGGAFSNVLDDLGNSGIQKDLMPIVDALKNMITGVDEFVKRHPDIANVVLVFTALAGAVFTLRSAMIGLEIAAKALAWIYEGPAVTTKFVGALGVLVRVFFGLGAAAQVAAVDTEAAMEQMLLAIRSASIAAQQQAIAVGGSVGIAATEFEGMAGAAQFAALQVYEATGSVEAAVAAAGAVATAAAEEVIVANGMEAESYTYLATVAETAAKIAIYSTDAKMETVIAALDEIGVAATREAAIIGEDAGLIGVAFDSIGLAARDAGVEAYLATGNVAKAMSIAATKAEVEAGKIAVANGIAADSFYGLGIAAEAAGAEALVGGAEVAEAEAIATGGASVIITIIGAALGALVTWLVTDFPGAMRFAAFVFAAFVKEIEAAEPVISGIASVMAEVASAVLSFMEPWIIMQTVLANIAVDIGGIIGWLGGQIVGLAQWLNGLAQTVYGVIAQFASAIPGLIQMALETMFPGAGALINGLEAIAGGFFGWLGDTISNAQSLVAGFVNWLGSVFPMVKSVVASISSAQSQLGQTALNGIDFSQINASLDQASSGFSDWANGLSNGDVTPQIPKVEDYASALGDAGSAASNAMPALDGLGNAAKGAGDKAAAAAKQVRTLTDYANDLSGVISRAFELRTGNQSAKDAITTQFDNMKQSAIQAKQAVAQARAQVMQYQASIAKTQADNQKQKFFLGIADRFGDSKRAGEIQGTIDSNNASIASDQSSLSTAKSTLADDISKATNSLTGNTAGAIANRAALNDLIAKNQAYIEELAKNGASQKTLEAAVKKAKEEFIKQAEKLGYTKQQAEKAATAFDDMVTIIKKVPRNITVKANADPALQALNEFAAKAEAKVAGAVGAMNKSLGGIGSGLKSKPISLPKVTSPAGNARQTEIAALEAEIRGDIAYMDVVRNGYVKKTIADQIAQLRWSLSAYGVYADGGFTGPGGKWEAAGIVHRGEYVVPKEMVNQSTGLPYADAMGKLVQGTPSAPSYASGGFVGNSDMMVTELGPKSLGMLRQIVQKEMTAHIGAGAVTDAVNNTNSANARRGRR